MIRDIINGVRKIDKAIIQGNTGNPYVFAKAIGISERSLYEYIRFMKSFNAPILYDRKAQTYVYTKDGSFVIGFVKQSI